MLAKNTQKTHHTRQVRQKKPENPYPTGDRKEDGCFGDKDFRSRVAGYASQTMRRWARG